MWPRRTEQLRRLKNKVKDRYVCERVCGFFFTLWPEGQNYRPAHIVRKHLQKTSDTATFLGTQLFAAVIHEVC